MSKGQVRSQSRMAVTGPAGPLASVRALVPRTFMITVVVAHGAHVMLLEDKAQTSLAGFVDAVRRGIAEASEGPVAEAPFTTDSGLGGARLRWTSKGSDGSAVCSTYYIFSGTDDLKIRLLWNCPPAEEAGYAKMANDCMKKFRLGKD